MRRLLNSKVENSGPSVVKGNSSSAKAKERHRRNYQDNRPYRLVYRREYAKAHHSQELAYQRKYLQEHRSETNANARKRYAERNKALT